MADRKQRSRRILLWRNALLAKCNPAGSSSRAVLPTAEQPHLTVPDPAETISSPRTIVLLGTPFHDITMEGTVEHISGLIAARVPRYVVTANLDFTMQAAADVELQRILVEAELVLCDGRPLVWASHFTGRPLRERVAGSDLVPRLVDLAGERKWKLYFLGGEPGSLERAVTRIKARQPGAEVCGMSPEFARFHDMDHAAIIADIRRERPDILFVAFGCPKQEKWIYANYRDLGVPVSIGVGATVDFLAGKVKRAPRWIGAIGLEWLFRLAQEPKRLGGRYAKDFRFLLSQILREREAMYRPVADGNSSITQAAQEDAECETLFWHGDLTASTIAKLSEPKSAKSFVLDLSGINRIDSSGLGFLLKVLRTGWAGGRFGCLCSPSEPVREILRVTRLDRVVPIADSIASARELIRRERSVSLARPMVEDGGESIRFPMPQRLVSGNVQECQTEIEREWNRRETLKFLTLDLGATTFVDSSGLGLLIRCKRLTAARAGGRLAILHPRPNVLNVIKVAGLAGMLLDRTD